MPTPNINLTNELEITENYLSFKSHRAYGKVSTEERDQFTPQEGDTCFNTTVNREQIYENGAWIEARLSGEALFVATPPTPGRQGQLAYDAEFLYVCVATDTWIRVPSTGFATENLFVAAPATLTSPGKQGQLAYDAEFLYVCVATDTWIRLPGTGFNIENLFVAAPATLTSPGKQGQLAYDAEFLYVCVATDTWIRVTGVSLETESLFIPSPTLSGTAPVWTATGKQGQVAYDNDYLYYWIETDQVVRMPLEQLQETREMYVAVPPTPTSPGIQGQRAYDVDNNYLYECVATDTWVRYAIENNW